MGNIDIGFVATQLVIIFVAIGIHEYAHCKFADLAGDPTARNEGRVTLNLFKHFDPLGSMMIVITCIYGFGIGWGKPAPMDPRKMRNPRWDFFAAVIAGPLSNVAQAAIYLVILKLWLAFASPVPDGAVTFLQLGALLNLMLAFFNMIPLGPLDGHWLLGLLMPERIRYKWFQFNRTYGTFILLAVIISGQIAPKFSVLSNLIAQPAFMIVDKLSGNPHKVG